MKENGRKQTLNYMQRLIDFFTDRYESLDIIKIGNHLGISKNKYWNKTYTGEELAEKFISLVFRLGRVDELLEEILADKELYRKSLPELVEEWKKIQSDSALQEDFDSHPSLNEKHQEMLMKGTLSGSEHSSPLMDGTKQDMVVQEKFPEGSEFPELKKVFPESSRETQRKLNILNAVRPDGILLKENLVAIVIGVEEYEIGDGKHNLPACTKDARELAAFLEYNWGMEKEKIHLFSGKVYYSEIMEQIKKICSSLTEQDKLLFYFAGNGSCEKNQGYLVLTDSRLFRGEMSRAIALRELNEIIRKCRAKIKLRIFDSMLFGENMSSVFEEEAFSSGSGWITFMPGSVGEELQEMQEFKHGVFSYFLLEGLKGGARRGEGPVYLEDLKIYLGNSVSAYVSQMGDGLRQTPQYHCEVKGNIILEE